MNVYKIYTKNSEDFEVFGDSYLINPTRGVFQFKADGAPHGITAEVASNDLIAIVLLKTDVPGTHLLLSKKEGV